MNFGSGFVDVPPPRNWKAMKLQVIFDQENYQAQLQTINFEWVKQNAVSIFRYFRNGLTGGTGIFEGPGLRIWIGSISPQLIFDGCIDTANQAFDIQSDIITCPLKESGRIDWMNDVSKSITFEYLTSLPAGSQGRITRSDYKQIPYALSTIPDYTQAMLLSISLFIIIKESIDVVSKIISLTVRAISQSLSWLQLVGTIIEIVLYLIYLVALIAASAKLIQQIADNLIQSKKTKLGMREVDLFKKGCEYFGLNFVSSIYGEGTADRYGGRYVNATLIPIKIKIPDGDPSFELFERPPDETTNPKSYGYYEGTFYDFLKDMEQTYHGRVIIKGNTMYFEELNYWNVADSFRLPNEGEVGNTFLYPQPYGTNANEIPAVYIVKFQKDEQDLNTYNDYKGTYVIAQATPNVVYNPKNQLLHGATKVDLPFALARRKVGYTKLEKMMLDLLDQYSRMLTGITDAINHSTAQMSGFLGSVVGTENVGLSNSEVGFVASFLLGNPAGGVLAILFGSDGLVDVPIIPASGFSDSRIGWMLLSSDFIGVKKRLIGTPNGDDWYVNENNSATQGWGSALSLMNDFHFNALIADNQWLVYKNKKFKFGIKDWLQINDNNVLITADLRNGKFEKIIWDLHNDIAEDVTYRIKEKYTNNYTLKITTDGG